jgi:hypothetical protein
MRLSYWLFGLQIAPSTVKLYQPSLSQFLQTSTKQQQQYLMYKHTGQRIAYSAMLGDAVATGTFLNCAESANVLDLHKP